MRKTVFITLLLSTIPVGCRFGNHIENSVQTDSISGFYETAPTAIQYCVTISGKTQCQSGSNLKPHDEVGLAMTNPVGLAFDSKNNIFEFIALPGFNYILPVFAQADGTLQGYIAPQPQPYWHSTTCNVSKSFEEHGNWTHTTGPWTSGKENQFPPLGRISIDFQGIISFEKDCTAILKETLDCYNDFNTCGEGSLTKNQLKQSEIRSIYNPYIESGTMNIADIPFATAMGYEVSYR